jgi:hypothetical protein
MHILAFSFLARISLYFGFFTPNFLRWAVGLPHLSGYLSARENKCWQLVRDQ